MRIAERLIRMTCRALPRAERAEREEEWLAEAEAVSLDPDFRFQVQRTAAVLRFALSLSALPLRSLTMRRKPTPHDKSRTVRYCLVAVGATASAAVSALADITATTVVTTVCVTIAIAIAIGNRANSAASLVALTAALVTLVAAGVVTDGVFVSVATGTIATVVATRFADVMGHRRSLR
ncbi:hypothetical protein ACWCPF_03995 [Streptomyces sp. NPDC001858]